MTDKYCIENDFAHQNEIIEKEWSTMGKVVEELNLLRDKLRIAEKEVYEFKKVLEEIEELYLDAEGPIIDGMEMGQKAYVVLKRVKNHVMWPYDEES